MCLKYFVDAGAMAVRRVLKRDLKRIAKASGGKSSASRQVESWCPGTCHGWPVCVGILVLSSFGENILVMICAADGSACSLFTNWGSPANLGMC